MFVDLTTGIDSKNVDHSSFEIYGKEDSPTAYTRLADSWPARERRGDTGIERVNRQVNKTGTNALFSLAVKAI